LRLSQNFIKIPLNKKALSPLYTPQKGAPMKESAHFLALLNIPFGFPSKGALPPVPFIKSSQRNAPLPEPSFIHLSKSPVYEPLLQFPMPLGFKWAPMERDA